MGNQNARLLVAGLASKQVGRIRYDQIRAFGVGKATIHRWCDAGYLYPELPRVYAVGHPGRSIESDLAAAVLYAGPGAMLSHGTGVWWLDLLKYPPRDIIVSTPRRVQSLDGIVVHSRRRLERDWRKGVPVTTPSRAIVDFAASGRRELLRLVLANADFHDVLDVTTLQRMIGMGVDGTVALSEALAIHLPRLALTRSRGEILLLEFFETQNIPIPEINVYVEGFLVDAVWHEQRVVVEVDGWPGHRTPAQLHADHVRDLTLRAKGFIVLRYTEQQLLETPEPVAAEITSFL